MTVVYIYIDEVLLTNNLYNALQREHFFGKWVFLGGGAIMQRKLGSESFWGRCLKQIRVTNNAHFKKKVMLDCLPW